MCASFPDSREWDTSMAENSCLAPRPGRIICLSYLRNMGFSCPCDNSARGGTGGIVQTSAQGVASRTLVSLREMRKEPLLLAGGGDAEGDLREASTLSESRATLVEGDSIIPFSWSRVQSILSRSSEMSMRNLQKSLSTRSENPVTSDRTWGRLSHLIKDCSTHSSTNSFSKSLN